VSLRVLGVMTGTSCDGLDATLVRFSKNEMSAAWSKSFPYPAALRRRVLAAQLAGVRLSLLELVKLHRDLGDWYAGTVKKIANGEIDVIANHGQTVGHFPPSGTLQMGEAACLAAKTGITVVSDFRWGDLVSGGQGAPLVPLFHEKLILSTRHRSAGVSIHNLGGISNLTYFDGIHPPRAWDTGPANLWMDAVIRSRTKGRVHFDRGGKLARRGVARASVVDALLDHPFFKKTPPKSTGRDDFREEQVLSLTRRLGLEDALASATLATARSIAQSYHRFVLAKERPLSKIYFCGGGAQNASLLELVQTELLDSGWYVEIGSSKELGVDPQFMESTAFACVGWRSLRGESLGGAWTGGSADAPPGKITPGKNWKSVLSKLRY
jgi:anhydro-N-acetylmuramic acid kinase